MSDNNWPEFVPSFGSVSPYYGSRYHSDKTEDMSLLLSKMEQWRRSKSITDLRSMKNETCSDSQYFRWAIYNWIKRYECTSLEVSSQEKNLIGALKEWAIWFDIQWRPTATHMKERRPLYLRRREWAIWFEEAQEC